MNSFVFSFIGANVLKHYTKTAKSCRYTRTRISPMLLFNWFIWSVIPNYTKQESLALYYYNIFTISYICIIAWNKDKLESLEDLYTYIVDWLCLSIYSSQKSYRLLLHHSDFRSVTLEGQQLYRRWLESLAGLDQMFKFWSYFPISFLWQSSEEPMWKRLWRALLGTQELHIYRHFHAGSKKWRPGEY